jgi:hypothetical protein
MADFNLGRIRFVWKGGWFPSTSYIRDDVVFFGGSSYVCVDVHTSSSDFATDSSKWELMADGTIPTTTTGDIIYRGSSGNTRLPIGTQGQALMVSPSGLPEWTGLVEAENVYYVSEDGSNSNDGRNLNKAFKTIRYACSQVTGPAVIFVKTGTYHEQLPIVVPAGVSVYGDGQRTTEVTPVYITANSVTRVATSGSQTSTTLIVQNSQVTGDEWQVGAALTGTGITGSVNIISIANNTPTTGFTTLTVNFSSQIVASGTVNIASDYRTSTMWQLSDASMLHKMYFTGLTGFTPNLSFPEDITQATVAGVYVALNPASPILTKSPYVLECSSFSTGGVGAVVDGSVHASGFKSIVFHAYTCINDDGVGFWVNGDGKSEIVSCFTYFCWFGYVTTAGGKIRSLNGNNSYGRYGAVSRGFDAAEVTNNGALYGDQIAYNGNSLSGEFVVGETVTGSSSGATGTVTNVQTANDKFYYISVSGSFQNNETVTGGTSGATATIDSDGVTGQKGFVLIADGFSAEPRPGGSIEFTSGDSNTYVIQAVSGTYVNSSSVMVIVLAGEKVTASGNNVGVRIRYNYSQSRLTGHDFLNIGTGNKTTTNYPGAPSQSPSQANEVIEAFPGRVFYVSTDQDGNFRVGDYFRVDQATGRATLNASAFDLSGLTSLRLGSIGAQLGELVNEFSSDDTLSGNSNFAVPTEFATRNYFTKVATNIVPVNDDVLSLGSPSKRWRDVYVGPGSINIGVLTISESGGQLRIEQEDSTPATINISELDTGGIRYFQNNIVGTNSNENIVINPNGTGSVSVSSAKISDLATPTVSTDAATKAYVDEVAQGIITKPAVEIATTANLTATYSNGTLGVGATLTATGNGAFPAIDGVTLTSTTPGENGVLVKNQSTPAQNGRYNLTQVGDAGTPWILTRCGLCDEASEIPGAYVFVKQGTLYKGTGWIQTVTNPATFVVGTDAIQVVQFSGAGSFSAGTGLTLTETTFSVNSTQTLTTLTLNAAGEVRFADLDSSHYVGFKSPETVSTNRIWTLPNSDGTNGQAIITNGSGVLSFSTVTTPPGGSSSQLQYNNGSGGFAGASGLVTDGSNLTLNAQSDLRFADSDSSHWVAFQAPATITTNLTWTLPAIDGTTGQVLTTNGSGVLSWASAASEITVTDDTTTTVLYPSMATVTSGSLSGLRVSSTKLSFNALTGILTSVDFNSTSDETLKTNIVMITEASKKILGVNGVDFNWKDSGKRSSGVLAQQLETILPHLVTTGDDGIKAVNYNGIIAYLIETVKEMDQRIKTLENKNGV